MYSLFYEDQAVEMSDDETVLDALLRAGYDIPYGCRAGSCQSCKMVAREGALPPASQAGLKPAEKSQGHFLSCQCRPLETLVVSAEPAIQTHKATLLEKTDFGNGVFRLRFTTDLPYIAGQYLNIWRDEHTLRSFSAASVPSLDRYLEVHIRRIEDGAVTPWLADTLAPGDSVRIQGAMGSCCYSAQDSTQPLLLAGIGTGLAPLYGITRDALSRGHSGPITLIVGARDENQFYLRDELLSLSKEFENFSFYLVAQQPVTTLADAVHCDIYSFTEKIIGKTAGFSIYLCGAESFVKKMKRQCFMAGANMPDIHSDAFLPFQ